VKFDQPAQNNQQALLAYDQNGQITAWSDSAVRLFGYRAEQVIEKRRLSWLFPTAFTELQRLFFFNLNRDHSGQWFGIPCRVLGIDTSGKSLPIDLQVVACQVNHVWSYTLYLATGSELAFTEQASQHHHNLDNIGQMTAGLAHDFNNICAIILGSLDLMANSNLPSPSAELVNTAISAAEQGAAIGQALLALARRESATAEIIDVNQLLEQLAPLLRQCAGKDIRLLLAPTPAVSTVCIDRSGLHNAIINAVINARDAMPNGGSIVICTHSTLLDADLAGQLGLSVGEYLVISIDDNGTGMSNQATEQAFQPFFTSKAEQGRGTGLGLSTIWEFCRQCSGLAQLESSQGHGTTLKLILPISRPANAPTIDRQVD